MHGFAAVSDLDESSACVVVVSPVAARRNAASAAHSPRHRRPPTPVEGDGFPSVADDPNLMLASSSNAVDTQGSSGGRPDDDSGAGRVERHPRYFYQVRGIPFGYGSRLLWSFAIGITRKETKRSARARVPAFVAKRVNWNLTSLLTTEGLTGRHSQCGLSNNSLALWVLHDSIHFTILAAGYFRQSCGPGIDAKLKT